MLREHAPQLRTENQALRRRLSERLGAETAANALPDERVDQIVIARLQVELESPIKPFSRPTNARNTSSKTSTPRAKPTAR